MYKSEDTEVIKNHTAMQLLLIKKKYITFIFSWDMMACEKDNSELLFEHILTKHGCFEGQRFLFEIKLLAILTQSKKKKKKTNKKLYLNIRINHVNRQGD